MAGSDRAAPRGCMSAARTLEDDPGGRRHRSRLLDPGGRRRARPGPGSGAPMSLVRPLFGTAGRIADRPDERDGIRVLVDRIWPRGMTTSRTLIEEQCKTIARRPWVRTWYHRDPRRFAEFRRRHRCCPPSPGASCGSSGVRSADVTRCSLLTSGDVTAGSRCRLSANRHSWTGGSALPGRDRWASRCETAHDPCRAGPGDATPVTDGRAPCRVTATGSG